MNRTVFVIPPNDSEVDTKGLGELTAELNEKFGAPDKTRYFIGAIIEKPKLLRASIETVLKQNDTETYLVLIRDDEQVYAPPDTMEEISIALRDAKDPHATSWDVLDKIIPHGEPEE